MSEKLESDSPSDAAACSRSSDTPYSDLHCWYYDASEAETRARREMTGYHVRLSAAQEMERRLHVIAADAACVSDEWLATQPEGIRMIIANIRRHANLSENAKDHSPIGAVSASKPESDSAAPIG